MPADTQLLLNMKSLQKRRTKQEELDDFFNSLGKEETATTQESSDPLSFLGKDISRTRSVLSAFPKGVIKEIATLGSMASPTHTFMQPGSQEFIENQLEEYLPTLEGPAEDILQFAGEFAPTAAFGAGGLAAKGGRVLAGGVAKKGAKEAELPEWMQDIVGVAGMSLPDALKSVSSKTLKTVPKQQQITDFLKSQGLTDKEITPIIQNPKKISWLSKAAFKYEEKSPFLKGIQEKLGGLYEDIRVRGQSGNYLQGPNLYKFENNFNGILEKLPRRHRRLVEKEIEELMNNPIDFTSLHDFNIAVNDIIKGTKGGKASIGKLKVATHDAQKSLDPNLFSDLRLTDEAYSKLMNFTDKMTKKNWDGLAKAGDIAKTITGSLILNPAMMGLSLKGLPAAIATRYLLRQMLVNPRLQNIHRKLQEAVMKNNFSQAAKLAELMKSEVEIEDLSEEFGET